MATYDPISAAQPGADADDEATAGPTHALSCVTCRSRKLKCDRTLPGCARCAKAKTVCTYPESRRKPTMKRKNMHELAERLAQVEGLLRDAGKIPEVEDAETVRQPAGPAPSSGTSGITPPEPGHGAGTATDPKKWPNLPDCTFAHGIGYNAPQATGSAPSTGISTNTPPESGPGARTETSSSSWPNLPDCTFSLGIGYTAPQAPSLSSGDSQHRSHGLGRPSPGSATNPTSPEASQQGTGMFGELLGLGQFESLPPDEMIEDLHNLFFSGQQQFSPFVHQGTYLRAFYSAPHMRPPMCLQYAIWTMASHGHAKYNHYHDVFYRRARHYLEADELKGHGEHFLTIAHAQAWALIATDESRMTFFTRATMSCARTVRLVHMMGLHRLDDPNSDMNPIAPTLAPPQSWVELEERRRVFWGAFCIDSHSSITTGWPGLVDPTDITTRLPCSEAAFERGQEEEAPRLEDVMNEGADHSTFAGAAIICHVFNILFKHLHRTKPSDRPDDLHGPFWKRHRELDNMLSTMFMFLPPRFRLPDHIREPVVVHKNLTMHACTISLHMTACDKVDENNLSEELRRTSQTRMLMAAQEIINIVKLTTLIGGHRSPLVSLALYTAAIVYIHEAKDDPSLLNTCNLEFLLHSMFAVGREHNITRAHLQQALIDAEVNGLMPHLHSRWHKHAPFGTRGDHRIPLLARSSVSRHSKPQPPLPGRLPLSKFAQVFGSSAAKPGPLRMPWYLTGAVDIQPNTFRTAVVVEEDEDLDRGRTQDIPGKGNKRTRVAKNPGMGTPVLPSSFMELPLRGSPVPAPRSLNSFAPPSSDNLFNPTIPPQLAPMPNLQSTPSSGGDDLTSMFVDMQQWESTAELLLTQVHDFDAPATDPWTLLDGSFDNWDDHAGTG